MGCKKQNPKANGGWEKINGCMNAVKEYMATLQGEERLIANYLYDIILSTSPKFKTKLSYGVPYFSINYRVCFVWPSSSPMAIEKEGVQLGLCKGNLLLHSQGVFEMGKRKVVAIANFLHSKQIKEDAIREVLFEAIALDEMIYAERRKKNNNSF